MQTGPSSDHATGSANPASVTQLLRQTDVHSLHNATAGGHDPFLLAYLLPHLTSLHARSPGGAPASSPLAKTVMRGRLVVFSCLPRSVSFATTAYRTTIMSGVGAVVMTSETSKLDRSDGVYVACMRGLEWLEGGAKVGFKMASGWHWRCVCVASETKQRRFTD